jgi:hypothetical protein
MISKVNKTIKEQTDGVHYCADSEADSDSLGVNEVSGGEIHDWGDKESDLYGKVGVGFGEVIDFGDFGQNRNDSIVGKVIDAEGDRDEEDNNPSVPFFFVLFRGF